MKVKTKIYKSEDLDLAIDLIEKFKKKNNIDFRLTINIDHDDENSGYYHGSSQLYVNPKNCDNDISLGHPNDHSIPSVIIHEFCHFVDDKYKIYDAYKKYIRKNKHLYITPYSETNIVEEVAENICTFLLNPFLYKYIDEKRYLWFTTYFKSPIHCTEKQFIRTYKKWTPELKKSCWTDYGVKTDGKTITYKKRNDMGKFKILRKKRK